MKYKIIHDEDELNRFIKWLPDTEKDECYLGSLFARKKYSNGVITSANRCHLATFDHSNKWSIKSTLQLYERHESLWIVGDVAAPQESLVTYMFPNPRSERKALRKIADTGYRLLLDGATGFSVTGQMRSALYSSCSRKFVITFDVDSKDINVTNLVDLFGDKVNDIVKVIETRGGYHLLIRPDIAGKVYPKWYPFLEAAYGDIIDTKGDIMSPIPGTIQGGFKVRMIDVI